VNAGDLASPVRFGSLALDAFVDRLASDAPTPDGGSASAVVGALGASLVAMVAALSDGHAASAAHAATWANAGAAGRDLAARFLALADEDAAAFARFGAAVQLPRASDEERRARGAAIRAAARAAADVPLSCLAACLELVWAVESLAGRSNPNLASDLVVASRFAEAAVEGAAANVRANVPFVGDAAWEATTSKRAETLLAGIEFVGRSTRYVIDSGVTRRAVGSESGNRAGIDRRELAS
jgi:formiminotetrahydrofolate cyclodeaminase